jgi:tRNA dimethylallyltransferase
MQNPQRMLRALEVKFSTGKSILDFHSGKKEKRNFEIKNILLELPREQLYHNINHRVDQKMQDGLLDEANYLFPLRHLNALQTVGYKELFDYFDGKVSLDEAVEEIKKNTRHYAKRQLTWFKKYLA